MASSDDFANVDHRAVDHAEGASCVWARMRDVPGLARRNQHGGFHVASRYDDLYEAAAKRRVFSSARGISFPDLDFATRMAPGGRAFLPRRREVRIYPDGSIAWKSGKNLGMTSLPLILGPLSTESALAPHDVAA